MKKLVKNKKKTIFEKIFKSRDPLVEGVRWTENYADVFEKSWKLIPSFVRTLILTTAIFLFGSTLRGMFYFLLTNILSVRVRIVFSHKLFWHIKLFLLVLTTYSVYTLF